MKGRAGPGSVLVHPLGWPLQHVPEDGAAALGLDFHVSLTSNNNRGRRVGSWSVQATGRGHRSGV